MLEHRLGTPRSIGGPDSASDVSGGPDGGDREGLTLSDGTHRPSGFLLGPGERSEVFNGFWYLRRLMEPRTFLQLVDLLTTRSAPNKNREFDVILYYR